MEKNIKKIGAGLYMEGDQLHVDIPEMLKELGFEDTEENRDLCMEVAEKALRETGLVSKTATSTYTHIHHCLMCKRKFEHEGKRKKCKLPKGTFCPRCNS